MRQFEVKVKPNSKLAPLIEVQPNDDMVVYLRAVPKEGRANKELIELIAKHLGVPKSRIEIIRGTGSRLKTIRVND
jgi:uncharacterized protein (TIGR00251 family)